MLDCLFPFLLFGAFIVFAAVLSTIQYSRVREGFRSLASEFGLEYADQGRWRYPEVSGEYRGRGVRVYVVVEGSGKHSRVYSVVQVKHRGGVKTKISIRRENFGSKLAKMVGYKEIRVGVTDFDDRFYITCQDEAEGRRVLGVDVQQALMNVKSPLDIEENIVVAKTLNIQCRDVISSTLNALCDVAERLDRV